MNFLFNLNLLEFLAVLDHAVLRVVYTGDYLIMASSVRLNNAYLGLAFACSIVLQSYVFAGVRAGKRSVSFFAFFECGFCGQTWLVHARCILLSEVFVLGGICWICFCNPSLKLDSFCINRSVYQIG